MFASSVTLIGRIVAEVVLRQVGTVQVAAFRIAVQRPLPSGETKACFYNVKIWNSALAQAIMTNPIYTKGLKVMVYGELDHEEWTGKDGVKHYDTVVRCVDIAQVLVPGGKANAAPAKAATKAAPKASAKATPTQVKKAKAQMAELAELAKSCPELAASLGLAADGVEEDFGV